MEPKGPFPYEGPETLRQTLVEALTRVVDPEVAMRIVDVGRIYSLRVADGIPHVLPTRKTHS